MGLTLYICGSSIILRIQRVELLVQPVLSRDPGVDGATDRFDRSWLHDRASPMANRTSLFLRPKKRGPFHLVPVNCEGNFGEAVIGLAVPGKAVSHHHHPLRLS